MNTRWSTMRTREADSIVWGVGKRFMVLATVVKNAGLGTLIINHVPNYPLGCTISYTQNILLFSFAQGDMRTKNFLTKMANAKFAKKLILTNTVMVVPVATSTFTLDVLFHRFKLNSTTTHWFPLASPSRSLVTFVAQKVRVCPICVSHVVYGFIEDVLVTHAEWKLHVTSTPSTSPILLKK